MEVCSAASRGAREAMQWSPRPATPPCYKALLMVGSVERNANEKKRDGEHEDTDKNVHLYSLPISSIRL
jgi:hypothetical protein